MLLLCTEGATDPDAYQRIVAGKTKAKAKAETETETETRS